MTTMTAARDIDFYELTEEQALLRNTLREFAQGEIAPRASKLDETGEFPWENVAKMREMGLFGIAFEGHPDLTRILMPEEWVGRPLRKYEAIGRIPVQFKGTADAR